VLATASKPMYAKKTVAEPATIPSTPNGKYLLFKQEKILFGKFKRPNIDGLRVVQKKDVNYPVESLYPTHPDLNPK
jgi:hypothetical protein